MLYKVCAQIFVRTFFVSARKGNNTVASQWMNMNGQTHAGREPKVDFCFIEFWFEKLGLNLGQVLFLVQCGIVT